MAGGADPSPPTLVWGGALDTSDTHTLTASGLTFDAADETWTVVVVLRKHDTWLDDYPLFRMLGEEHELDVRWDANGVIVSRGGTSTATYYLGRDYTCIAVVCRRGDSNDLLAVYSGSLDGAAADVPGDGDDGTLGFAQLTSLTIGGSAQRFAGAFVLHGGINTGILSALAGGADPRTYYGAQDIAHMWSPAHSGEDGRLIDFYGGADLVPSEGWTPEVISRDAAVPLDVNASLILDGLTQYGIATWAEAFAGQAGGVSMVLETVHEVPTGDRMALRLESVSPATGESLLLAAVAAARRMRSNYQGTQPAAAMGAVPADSAGYALHAAYVEQRGADRYTGQRNLGPSGTGTNQLEQAATATILGGMRRLLLGSNVAAEASALYQGKVARVVVASGAGLTADDMAALYAAEDWREAEIDPDLVEVYYPCLAYEHGAALRIPSTLGGPILEVGTSNADDIAEGDVPTRVAA